jgi:hypothetical protein
LTRASINLQKTFSKPMDCRIKPGNDGFRDRSVFLLDRPYRTSHDACATRGRLQ